MNRKGGPRRKTRNILKKEKGNRGKISIRNFFQSFKEGEKVQLLADSSIQKGCFPLTFYGKIGIIKSKKGKRAYEVEIRDKNKIKSFIVGTAHLKKFEVHNG